jgi:hypothetical protein
MKEKFVLADCNWLLIKCKNLKKKQAQLFRCRIIFKHTHTHSDTNAHTDTKYIFKLFVPQAARGESMKCMNCTPSEVVHGKIKISKKKLGTTHTHTQLGQKVSLLNTSSSFFFSFSSTNSNKEFYIRNN